MAQINRVITMARQSPKLWLPAVGVALVLPLVVDVVAFVAFDRMSNLVVFWATDVCALISIAIAVTSVVLAIRAKSSLRVILPLALIPPVTIGVCLIVEQSAAAEAEIRANNTEAARFTIALVTKFIRIKGRWPKLWEDLEAMPPFPSKMTRHNRRFSLPSSELRYQWPDDSSHIKALVHVDF